MTNNQSRLGKLFRRNKTSLSVSGSPILGITLQEIISLQSGNITQIAWSPDGIYLAMLGSDGLVSIWNNNKNDVTPINFEFFYHATILEWAPDGKSLAMGTQDKRIIIWNVEIQRIYSTIGNLEDPVRQLAWSPDGNTIGCITNNSSVLLWNAKTGQFLRAIKRDTQRFEFTQMTWFPNGHRLVTLNYSGVHIWDPQSGTLMQTIEGDASPNCFAWSRDKRTLAIGMIDRSISIWDTDHLQRISTLEGHKQPLTSLSFSADSDLLISSDGSEVRIWRCRTWETLTAISNTESLKADRYLVFHPQRTLLTTFGELPNQIFIWNINTDILLDRKSNFESIRYMTAKIVLVGDSGVGKTGLGWRLANNEFKDHPSTHGQQFWVIPELGQKRNDGTECEAVLWDLAGQPDYRLVHSLYLDDVDVALILFDPTDRQEPLAGVDYWINQLKDKDKRLRNSILVGARTDRGTSTLTDAEIRAYCEKNMISGGYIPTSSMRGHGLPQLLKRLKEQIPWGLITTTVTTVTFKKIKEFVLKLKEKTNQISILVNPDDLIKQLHVTDNNWEFSYEDMITAIGHLETHGYVKIIHNSNGEHFILLSPDVLANLASSIVLEARRNSRGLGVLEEDRLLKGDYTFPELINLSKEEGKILLDSSAVLFIEHNICFRETFNEQVFLVFPSLINEKRPVDETFKTEEGASYRVKGAVETIYASLVVLLGYTNTFIRTHQWQNQAQYEMGEGEICGFQQTDFGDSGLELVLYYGLRTPESVRLMFRGMFERFLGRRELEISRYQPVKCTKCGSLLARNVVLERLNEGDRFSFCHKCGMQVSLPDPEPLTRLSPKEEVELDAQQAIAAYRTAFEAALVRVKALLRDQGREEKPTCFISYAWGISENERWVLQLAKDLRHAEIDVLLDRWHSPPGSNLDLYLERIDISKFVIVVGTPELRQKYDTRQNDPVVAAELKLINLRVRQPSRFGETVLPVLLTGEPRTSFTPQLQPLVSVDFRETEFYFRKLFDMIWRLYDLSFDNPLLDELQASMTPQKR